MSAEPTLLAGTLDLLILRTLAWGPRHGYAVARWIKDTSDEAIEVEDRALYLSLHRLEARGFVESDWGVSDANGRAKLYQLTRVERGRLARERWAVRGETLRQDAASAVRGLRRNTAFSATVIGVLAIGIGANATMFGVIDRLLLSPPAHVSDPAHVVTADYMRTHNGMIDHQEVLSYPQYL